MGPRLEPEEMPELVHAEACDDGNCDGSCAEADDFDAQLTEHEMDRDDAPYEDG